MSTLKQDADHARRLAETAANDKLQKELLEIAADLLQEERDQKTSRRGKTQRTVLRDAHRVQGFAVDSDLRTGW